MKLMIQENQEGRKRVTILLKQKQLIHILERLTETPQLTIKLEEDSTKADMEVMIEVVGPQSRNYEYLRRVGEEGWELQHVAAI